MNRALPLFLLLALILAAGAWLLQDPADPDTDPLTGPGVEQVAPTTTERSAPELDADEPEPDAEPVAVTSERSSVSSEQAGGLVVRPWPDEGLDLTVVHAATGLPAADALVHVLAGDENEVRSMTFELLSQRDDLSPVRLILVPPYQADEAGRVRIPEPSKEALVRVSLGDERGYELLGGLFESDLRVELAEPRTLELAVQDSSGVGQGNVSVDCDGPWSQLVWGSLSTSPDGVALLRNGNTLLAPTYGAEPPLLEVSVRTWDDQQVAETVDLRAIPEAPVRLVLPAGGEVQVTVRDSNGEAIEEGSRQIELDVVSGATSRTMEDWTWGDQVARFRGLPPGAAVTARLGDFSDSKMLAPSEGTVPPAGGEPLLLVVTVAPQGDRSITGRLVDAEGEPLANGTYNFRSEIRLGGGSSSSSTGRRRTDGEGRFEEKLGSHMVTMGGGSTSLVLTFQVDREEGTNWSSEQLRFEGPLELPMDLGDVVCAAPPLLVSGRVEDSSGNPVEGAWVRVSFLPADQPEPEEGMSSFHMRQVDGQTGKSSGADGAFAVHARTTEARLYASAGADGFADSEPVAIRAGSTGVVLTLQGAGSLMGSARVPDGTAPESWTAGIQPVDEVQRESFSPDTITGGWSSDGTWWDSDLDRGANFGWRDLRPGYYNVRIKLEGINEPVHQWDQLLVESGEVNRDPRLQDIDLDGLVTTVPIEVVDPGGAHVPQAKVKATGGEGWQPWTELPGGRGSMAVVDLPVDLLVLAEGYLATTVAADGGALRVVVEPAPTITLVLPAGLQLPEDGELEAQLRFPDLDEFAMGFGGSTSAEFKDGRGQVSMPALGRVRIELTLRTSSGFGSSMDWLYWPDEPCLIDVTAASDGVSFDVPVTQAMVDEAAGQ